MLQDSKGEKHTILAEHLSGHDLLVEVGLALFNTGREALVLCIVDQALDSLPLSLSGGLGLLLLCTRLFTLVPSQGATELGVLPSLVVEVGKVGWEEKERLISSKKRVLNGMGGQDIPMTPVAAVATEAVTIVDVETILITIKAN